MPCSDKDKVRTKRDRINESDEDKQKACSNEHTYVGYDGVSVQFIL